MRRTPGNGIGEPGGGEVREPMPAVTLVPASVTDAPLISELIEQYALELSAVFPNVVRGPDGRFGYPRLPLYWSEPDRRFAFVIRADGAVAGFALATRGSPAATDPEVLDVAEFFVLRSYRRLGVGRRAARLLWSRLPGTWTVRVAEANRGGVAFWAGVLAEPPLAPTMRASAGPDGRPWRIYTFEAAARPDAGTTDGATK